jgi:hypothetical protein
MPNLCPISGYLVSLECYIIIIIIIMDCLMLFPVFSSQSTGFEPSYLLDGASGNI